MSNFQLRSEVSRLESKLHNIERENSQLQTEIRSAVNSINQAEQDLSAYNQHVRSSLEHAASVIDNSVNRSLSAYELQGQIDRL